MKSRKELHSRAELKGHFPLSLTPNFSWVSRLAWFFNRFNGFSNVSVIVRACVHQQLRERILGLPGVTERQHAGIHEDAFFVGPTMFMHIHGHGHCDIRLSKEDQELALAEGNALPHRWPRRPDT